MCVMLKVGLGVPRDIIRHLLCLPLALEEYKAFKSGGG